MIKDFGGKLACEHVSYLSSWIFDRLKCSPDTLTFRHSARMPNAQPRASSFPKRVHTKKDEEEKKGVVILAEGVKPRSFYQSKMSNLQTTFSRFV
jgi:hypothetical protein